jgi:hypothetical protein
MRDEAKAFTDAPDAIRVQNALMDHGGLLSGFLGKLPQIFPAA